VAIGRLLEGSEIRSAADLGNDPRAPLVDNLGGHRTGPEHATNEAIVVVAPRLHGAVAIVAAQRLTPVAPHVIGDDDLPFVSVDDARTARQLDQDRGHRRILNDRLARQTDPELGLDA
jgi:hypothetical protein